MITRRKTPKQPAIRDRIRELRRVKAADLRPHPKNFQRHGDEQRRATEGMLKELGYADALIGRELEDGAVQILDGHLRAEITPQQEVPILIVDLDDREADLFLATHDPLVRMADIDLGLQVDLLRSTQAREPAAQDYLAEMLSLLQPDGENQQSAESPATAESPKAGDPLPEQFSVVIDCEGEDDQKALFDRMRKEGRKCRLLTL